MKNKITIIKNELATLVVVTFLVLASALITTMVPAQIAEAQFNQPSTTITPSEEEDEDQEVVKRQLELAQENGRSAMTETKLQEKYPGLYSKLWTSGELI
jgi:hypothetical protein